MTGASWKGIAPSVLDAAGVTVDVDGIVHLPCRNRAGEVLRERLADNGRRWWGPGEGVHLFGAETLTEVDPDVAVLVTEGESDALAVREHLGYLAVGCPGSSAWRQEWRAMFEDVALIYAVGDGDAAGERFAWSVRKSIPWVRPVVCPEGRDLRDLLQAGETEVVIALLTEADAMARLEHVVLHAPDLATAERWLRHGIPT